MPVPSYKPHARFDDDAIRIPELVGWLCRLAQGDEAIWESFVDARARQDQVRK